MSGNIIRPRYSAFHGVVHQVWGILVLPAPRVHAPHEEKMVKELRNDILLRQINLSRRDFTVDQAHSLMAAGSVEVSKGVRLEQDNRDGTSTAEADVQVDAECPPGLTLHSVVQVRLTCKGDLRAASRQANDEITLRLRELARRYCLEAIIRRIDDGTKRPQGRPPRKQ